MQTQFSEFLDSFEILKKEPLGYISTQKYGARVGLTYHRITQACLTGKIPRKFICVVETSRSSKGKRLSIDYNNTAYNYLLNYVTPKPEDFEINEDHLYKPLLLRELNAIKNGHIADNVSTYTYRERIDKLKIEKLEMELEEQCSGLISIEDVQAILKTLHEEINRCLMEFAEDFTAYFCSNRSLTHSQLKKTAVTLLKETTFSLKDRVLERLK